MFLKAPPKLKCWSRSHPHRKQEHKTHCRYRYRLVTKRSALYRQRYRYHIQCICQNGEMRMPSDKERQRRSQSRSDHGSLKRVVIYEVNTSGSPTSIEIKAENSVRGRAVYAFLVFFNFVEYLHIHIYAVRIWGTFEMNVQNEW